MIKYNIVIALIYIIQIALIILFACMTYTPTKDIIIKNLEKELQDFHSKHLQNNYHLELINLNSLESIDRAMLEIKAEPDFYGRIPDEEIIFINMVLKWLRNYRLYQKRIFHLILFTVFVIESIKFGMSLI